MYLHFGSLVQLTGTGDSKWGGERQRHNSEPFHKNRQAKTPDSQSGKLALNCFIALFLPVNQQDNTGAGV